ncbi:MAG: hypothetical protein EPO11_03270 [Gammaproteobacteria bacterium]|nr:MAG: hypothetical protein EPO11_03270 [Gammaproteobacteria bacterium]
MTEKFHEPLAPRHRFILRLLTSTGIGLCLITIALFIGMLGYHLTEEMSWIDAFANASMILSGMGPLTPLHTSVGKLFAGFYALFSGLLFILIIGLIFAPVVHRFFHKWHISDTRAS